MNTIKKAVLMTCLFLIILISGCSKTVCSVGDISITEKDIELRTKVSEVMYPGSGKRYVAAAQLIKGYLSLQTLKSLGYKVDAAAIEAEARRIDENTKAPEVLKKIKDIFGGNSTAYLKIFVQVVYAERVLYNEVFLKSGYSANDAYDNWFWIAASKVPVTINDRALKDELLGNVSWARNLRPNQF